MAQRWLPLLLALLGVGAVQAAEPIGELQVEIHEPEDGRLLTSLEREIRVEGGASIFGGVRYLDLFLVLDTSKSLLRTDPKDYRVAGAVALVKSLPRKSDIQIGLVEFDRNAEIVAPLTPDRAAMIAALRSLDRTGATDLAEGIHAALAGFEAGARPGSSKVVLLFTDGKSDEDEALEAMREARRRGVAIHTLLLGSDRKGTQILGAIAEGTSGSFLRVTDPSRLPEAFLGLRTTGVESVSLRLGDGPLVPAALSGGLFSADLVLAPGRNRIVATATSLDGETRDAEVEVFVSDEISLEIETPGEGSVYTEGETRVKVTGSASLFASAAPDLERRHPDHGIARVVLRVGDSPPFATRLEGGRFEGEVMLQEGENRILATATSHDGRVADTAVRVVLRPPGCGELEVHALRDGLPARSISDRAVEVVLDASNSMWGRMDGVSKMEIAKRTLGQALDELPEDLSVALRVYGHRQPRERRDCQDSELLVPFGAGGRERIRQAIPSFKPRGQTPLGYSLEQVAGDFGDFDGERAVVLVTDGLESCGGDPVAAARSLQAGGSLPVHVIGFGLGGDDEDADSLRAIAAASGGRFLAAASAAELGEALSVTIGTPYRVTRAGSVVAEGALGAPGRVRLPPGPYTVEVASRPPHAVPVELVPEELLTLVLERRGGELSHDGRREPTPYARCADPTPRPGLPAAPDDRP